jgi:hypothetical protein
VTLENGGIFNPRSGITAYYSRELQLNSGAALKARLDALPKGLDAYARVPCSRTPYGTSSSWYQPFHDILYFNPRTWNVAANPNLDIGPVVDRTDPPLVTLHAERLFDDGPYDPVQVEVYGRLQDSLARLRKEFLIVTTEVRIRSTPQEAADPGLFGLLGDDPIQLVDPTDLILIERYHKLGAAGASKEEPVIRSSTGTYRELETTWYMGVSNAVMEAKLIQRWISVEWWRIGTRQGAKAVDDLGQVRVPHIPWSARDCLCVRSPSVNPDSPWVQTILTIIPAFKPRILYKLGNVITAGWP